MSENKMQESLTNVIAEGRSYKGFPVPYAPARAIWLDDFNSFLDRIEAAYKRDIEKLNSVIKAQRSAFDAEQDRQRREREKLRKMLAQMAQTATAARTCRSDEEILRTVYLEDIAKLCETALALFSNSPENENTVADNVTARKLPDGWKMYDKYQIRHTDGTPLKGKRYFVLRLDSDDPLEAARVAAAMSAYKGESQSPNAAKLREAMLEVLSRLEPIVKYMHPNKEERIGLTTVFAACEPIYKIANAALAAPARNCDVISNRDDAVRMFQAAFVKAVARHLHLTNATYVKIIEPLAELLEIAIVILYSTYHAEDSAVQNNESEVSE